MDKVEDNEMASSPALLQNASQSYHSYGFNSQIQYPLSTVYYTDAPPPTPQFPVLSYEPSYQQYSYAGFWPAQQEPSVGNSVVPALTDGNFKVPTTPVSTALAMSSNAERRAKPRAILINGKAIVPHGSGKTRTSFKVLLRVM